jgi:Bacteriophage T4-like portal protein (Gp20)
VSQFSSYWKIITPATRKQLYTTISTDAYDPRTTDLSSLTAVSWYSQVLRGPGSRINSYKQYDSMDADIDISRSLDIIAEEMTSKDAKTDLPFVIKYEKEDNQDISDTTVITLRSAVRQWSHLQELKRRTFGIARCLIKNGDCFFRKTSDTKKWAWVDPGLVYGIEVDQNGNKISYHLRRPGKTAGQNGPSASMTYGTRHEEMDVIPAAAMVHFSMSDEMGDSAPFGQSVLRPIFRVFRQLSMIEDSVIIYRIVRAPERRVFYVDVGNMPAQRVKQYLEQIKNEIRQKRSPGQTGGGGKDIVDGQYDPQCLTLDTRVPLLDGRTLSLAELIQEHEEGKQNWAYSCHPVTGEISPGEITWAGKTRLNTQVVKVTLDTGETITCTPDHRFPVQGVGFVQAQHLTPEMSLVPLNRRWVNGAGTVSAAPTSDGYEELFDVSKKQWIKTHQLVGDSIELHETTYRLDEPKVVIHHADFNKHNNEPSNLVRMGVSDHILFHTDHNKERWQAWEPERQERQLSKLWAGRTEYANSLSHQRVINEQGRVNAMLIANRKAGRGETVRRHSTYAPAISQRLKVSHAAVSLLVDKVKLDPAVRQAALISWMRNDANFLASFKSNNIASTTGRRAAPTWTYLEVIKEHLSCSTFAELKSKLLITNHKVRSVELILETQDTGCLTVGEKLHDNHTFALESGVFVANSMQEDFFFPVTATGRGSRVETLPGGTEDFGTNLLKYFQDKMSRGLRIPTSYMGGGEGQGAQYNDGKVGIAYIEELRFVKFVMRLQDRINDVMDQEFKVYCKVVGLNVDDEIFRIQLPEPANFALYRQAALDADLIGSYNNISQDKTLSKRFLLKRYLGLTDDEIQMNEAMVKEERGITENANIPSIQQLYDPSVYENREQLSVEQPDSGAPVEDAVAGGLGSEDDIGGGFFAGGQPPVEQVAAETPDEVPVAQ